MSARNIRLLGMCLSTLTSRCAIENCIMSARNIRATAHAPCSQHTFNQNLEPKTDQFHGLYSTGDAIDFTSGRRAELKHDVICLRLVNSTWSIWSSRVSCQVFGWTWTERCDAAQWARERRKPLKIQISIENFRSLWQLSRKIIHWTTCFLILGDWNGV